MAGAAAGSHLPAPTLAEIAFAGRSNVGKSSLINALVQRKNLVRTSSTPGCTRQVNLFEIALDRGPKLGFVDLPGYGYAKRSKAEAKTWKLLIEGYLGERVSLRALVLIVDVRRGLEEEEHQLLDFMAGVARANRPDVRTLIVATKLDKVPKSKQKPTLAKVQVPKGHKAIGFSSVTRDGADALWREIEAAAFQVEA